MTRFTRPFRRPFHSFDVLESRRLLTTTAVSSTLNTAKAAALTVDYSAVSTMPTVSFSDLVVAEGRRGAVKYATVTVTLSEATSQPVVIGTKTQAGTAMGMGSARDFVATAGTITIKAGHTSGTIRIKIIGDKRAEADETFNVVATRVKNATLAASTSGTSYARVVIRDNDTANLIRPTVSISNPSVVEGSTAAFVVSLSTASTRNVTVRYTTQPGTASTSRFTSESGILTIPAGQTSATIYVPTSDNGVVEGSRTFGLKLSAAANADLVSDTATATLIDNGTSPADPVGNVPAISVSPAAITEGDTGPHVMNFIVTLSAASNQTVTVNYATVAGTAIAGSDYTAVSGTLSFAPGVTSLIVPVTITNDTTFEATETFSLALSNALNATIDRATAVGTIFDNDQFPSASIASVSGYEGKQGDLTPFVFTVTLSAASGATGTVDYATAYGTAVAGQDYVSTSGTLTFAPGVTSQTITVYVIGNDAAESTKMFTVYLSNPTNLRLAADTSIADGKILNDDTLPSLAVSSPSIIEGTSGTTDLTFLVTLTAAASSDVTVDFATADGTAVSGTDYTATSGTLTFTAGITSQTVNVPILDDTGIESDEIFTLTLSDPSSNAVLLRATGTGTIVDSGITSTEA